MSNKICGIYCIENLIDGKKYIGQSNDIKRRFYEHKSLLKNNHHKNVHLQYAYNKYGINNFKFYVLEECSINEIDEREKYYISVFNSTSQSDGYNIEPGGHVNKMMSDKTKQKISKSLKGREFTDEHRQKIGEANRHRVITEEMRQHMRENHANFSGNNHPQWGTHPSDETREKMSKNHADFRGEKSSNYGRHLSDETKRKLSKSHKGLMAGNRHPRCKSVYCPELDRKFWGATEAEQEGITKASYVSSVLIGKQKSAGKHPTTGEPLHWFYADEYVNDISI